MKNFTAHKTPLQVYSFGLQIYEHLLSKANAQRLYSKHFKAIHSWNWSTIYFLNNFIRMISEQKLKSPIRALHTVMFRQCGKRKKSYMETTGSCIILFIFIYSFKGFMIHMFRDLRRTLDS